MISISKNFNFLFQDLFFALDKRVKMNDEENAKLEANICPFCNKTFNFSLELLKHVVHVHNCLECSKTCQHKAVINQDYEPNQNEPIVKSEITKSPENECLRIQNIKSETISDETVNDERVHEHEQSQELVKAEQRCDNNENVRIEDQNVLIKSEIMNPDNENENRKDEKKIESSENATFLRVRNDLFSDQATSSNNEKQDYSVLNTTYFKCCICKITKFTKKGHNKCRNSQEEEVVNHILSKHESVTKANVKDFYQECPYYKCDYCDQEFRGEDEVKEHIKLMTKEELFTCKKCDTLATNMLCVLQKHRRQHMFPCQICSAICNNLKELENHKKRKHEQIEHKYQCDICYAFCSNLQDLENHKKKKHSYNCKKCEFTCDTAVLMEDHKLNQHNYQCDICHTVCDTLQELENHDKRKHKTHQCTVCEEYFYSKPKLAKHIKTHEDLKECEFCQLSFQSQKSLNLHLKLAHAFKCELCGERFKRLSDLHGHQTICFNSRHHCKLCERSFKEKDDLRNHLINFHFMCSNCKKFLNIKQSLDEHKAQFRCSGFKCYKCDIGFPSEIELNTHNNSQHPNEYVASIRKANKTFVNCEYCNEKFTSQMNLKFHMEIVHSNRKRKAEETESMNSPPEKRALFEPSKPNQ